MSDLTYYTNDGYFNEIIHGYFDKKSNWKNSKNSKNIKKVTFFNSLTETCQKCKIVSDFKDTSALGNKKKLYQNLIKYGEKNSLKLSYLPETYSFTIDENLDKFKKLKFWKNKEWILKPEFGMRQEGIGRVRNYSEFYKWLKNNETEKKWIIQRYVHTPLLYMKKKFHFRVYAFILRYGNRFEGWVYPEGYMYVADKEYTPNVFDKYTHITTSCNNKTFPGDYNTYFGEGEFEKKILPQIKTICKDSILATYKTMTCPNENLSNDYICWKMIAYDIIPSISKKLYLMEANARIIGMAESDPPGNCYSKTPSLQTKEFKTGLMYNMLNISLDKLNNLGKLIQPESKNSEKYKMIQLLSIKI